MSDENNVMDLDDESNIIELEDEDGQKVEFELLDYIEYRGGEYIVLLPMDDDSTVIILKVEPIDEETENYVPIEDEALVNKLYEMFKERNADLFDFE